MCGSDDGITAGALVSDFISRVGIGDPYSVVFHLPGSYESLDACRTNNRELTLEVSCQMDTGISEGLLIALLKLLMKYLMDDYVKIVDMASQALRAILSTERGQKALQSFVSYKRSLVEVHSKGINLELVEEFLTDLERKYKGRLVLRFQNLLFLLKVELTLAKIATHYLSYNHSMNIPPCSATAIHDSPSSQLGGFVDPAFYRVAALLSPFLAGSFTGLSLFDALTASPMHLDSVYNATASTRTPGVVAWGGYIVGLGDRHSMNILIDQATAEVVHIDLGVAFEQGLMLKTPERVPFRRTRDIIDGMGVTGVEGVFRRCCEETLSVMRTNEEALLTIVEVFIHDPLYKWALSPLKALQRQKETEDDPETSSEDSQDDYEGNKDAARALMRVKQKLDGYEEGEMRSVHGQVQQLIQDAIDPERLCQMFPGWGAWL
ncbi:Serine/threonine-protein kinase ATM [Morus notabilis]|uniref:Serine/threonine-protein kinase ATM n=1 Tax=Morus notabilis TaxID=981085 RepID=W9QMH8_9ROSA|nr:Serine/threonine-protein kinase ATM [Morus notabilis]